MRGMLSVLGVVIERGIVALLITRSLMRSMKFMRLRFIITRRAFLGFIAHLSSIS